MEYTISPEQYDHIKQNGFNPKICPECQEIDIIFKEQLANANLMASAPDLYEACKAQHQAIDLLFARLIQLDEGFLPSKSGRPWEATLLGNQAITKAERR